MRDTKPCATARRTGGVVCCTGRPLSDQPSDSELRATYQRYLALAERYQRERRLDPASLLRLLRVLRVTLACLTLGVVCIALQRYLLGAAAIVSVAIYFPRAATTLSGQIEQAYDDQLRAFAARHPDHPGFYEFYQAMAARGNWEPQLGALEALPPTIAASLGRRRA